MKTLNQDEQASWNQRFKRFFRPAVREIELLRIKVSQKDGLLFFKWHKYTIQELTNSEHHSKIDAVTRKIGDDVSNLYKRGQIPDGYKETYEDHKTEVEDKLHEVNILIQGREPTWLESAWHILTEFAEKVQQNMPPLVRNLIEEVGVFMINKLNLPGSKFLGLLLLPRASSGENFSDEE
ncbi:MAG: hypothetical protein PT120_11410 [Aphanizomenon gracile PMC649.10]|jgi:hypothetical protein|nr:hypothetical protein [Aphanizomenon gracile PMC649.10]